MRISFLSVLESLSDESCHEAKAFSRAAEVMVLVATTPKMTLTTQER